jgi:hypothetical protein
MEKPVVRYRQTELLGGGEGCTFTPDDKTYPIIHLTMGQCDEVIEESFYNPEEPFVHFRVHGNAEWSQVPRLIQQFATEYKQSEVNGFRDILMKADLVYTGPAE